MEGKRALDPEKEPLIDKSSSLKIQDMNPTLSGAQTSIHTVNIPEDVAEYSRSSSSVQKKQPIYSKLFTPQVCENISYFIRFVYRMVLTLLFIFGTVVASFAALPLLVMSLFFIRILQFIRYGEGYDNASQLKSIIRNWICMDMMLVLLEMAIFFPFAMFIPGLYHMMPVGIPLTSWIGIICMLSGFCILDFFLSRVIEIIPQISLEHNDSGNNVSEAFHEIIDCLLIWWAETEVMKRVPALNQQKILGLHTDKWIEVSLFVLIGYNIIILSSHMIMWLLWKVCQDLDLGANIKSQRHFVVEKFLRRKYLLFYANGMRRSINFILSVLLILLTWMLYFGFHLNDTHAVRIFGFGTITCLTLLAASLLWMIKKCIFLSLESHAVYDRLHSKILKAGKQLYFLGIIGRHSNDILKLRYDVRQVRSLAHHFNPLAENKEEMTENEYADLFSIPFADITSSDINYWLWNKLEAEDEDDEWGENEKNQYYKKKLSIKKRNRVRGDLLMKKQKTLTVYDIQQVAQYILAAKNALSKDTFTSEIMNNLKSGSPNDDPGLKSVDTKGIVKRLITGVVQDPSGCLTQNLTGSVVEGEPSGSATDKMAKEEHQTQNLSETSKQEMNKDPSGSGIEEEHIEESVLEDYDWDFFVKSLIIADPSKCLSFDEVEKWMNKAHSNCSLLAYTLSSAKEVVDGLDKFISALLIAATFITWLLLTGLASTQVLVLITSPLLAATFIFGDTCKTIFQGIIFVYVVHPFDVGDLCVIDEEIKLVVKAIDLWKTTFSKVDNSGLSEEVIYPNSKLASSKVINYKTDYDWSDHVELDVSSLDRTDINELKKMIEKRLSECPVNSEEYKFMPSAHSITVLLTKESVTMEVHFKHKIRDIQELMYSECLRRKYALRADFCLYIKDLVKEFKQGIEPRKPENSNLNKELSQGNQKIPLKV